MLFKFPKDNDKRRWTRHVKNKMLHYALSESRILRVINNPKRKEEGIAPSTVAVMQRNDKSKRKEEIWVMFQEKSKPKITIISAWRYPGESKPGKAIPIPEDILAELEEVLN